VAHSSIGSGKISGEFLESRGAIAGAFWELGILASNVRPHQ